MKVLIVEDDPIIVEGLKVALSQEEYEVEAYACMQDALEAVKKAGEVHFDVCLLDINLPDGDGFQVCRAIRERSEVPIIFLTACDDEIHTVLALEQGADDYIAKPFRIRELIARIRAVLRRSGKSAAAEAAAAGSAETKTAAAGANEDIVQIGKNLLNIRNGKVTREGEEIFLSAVEYRLLLTFVGSRGQLLTRQRILSEMWDSAGDFVNDNTLTVYVRRLRKKLEQEGDEPVIQTVRGIGYRMD
ncbi:MAG: response regulator transcription factor [Lachnospiraceae bacterium]|nr:response regulator transcription factor [Lachnospiraceae bacterium]